MKRIFNYVGIVLGLVILCLCGCNRGNTDNDSKVSTINTIKSNASYGDDMVVVSEMDYNNGKYILKYYNPKTKDAIFACSLANCTHDISDSEIKCNAIFEGTVSYPFLYKDKLYYFLTTVNTALYESNADGTDKKKISNMDFSIGTEDAIFKDGKLYVTSDEITEGKQDENGTTMIASEQVELYEIDINTGKQKQLTQFGSKASASQRAITMYENKIYMGLSYSNKNIYDSELKTWNNYNKWMSGKEYTNKSRIDMFDEHIDYYCIDISTDSVEKMKINYKGDYSNIDDSTGYFVGMDELNDYYNFNIIYANSTDYYYVTSYGDWMCLYKYNIKDGQSELLDKSYRMTYACDNKKIYIEKTQYDKNKKRGDADSEDKSIQPEYRCYDTEKNSWNKLSIKDDINGKVIRIEAVSDKYLYGTMSDFTKESDDMSKNNGQLEAGVITAVKKIEE
ncbi:hypothetical protein [Eubacterium sp.]